MSANTSSTCANTGSTSPTPSRPSTTNLACVIEDPDHEEQRFVLTGIDAFGHVLVVVDAQPDEQTIRIISARPATAAERRHYERD